MVLDAFPVFFSKRKQRVRIVSIVSGTICTLFIGNTVGENSGFLLCGFLLNGFRYCEEKRFLFIPAENPLIRNHFHSNQWIPDWIR